MSHQFEAGADALVMDERDHVATALRDLSAGETVRYRTSLGMQEVAAAEAIPFGHKVAVAPIAPGTDVRKYGEVIGRSTARIEPGQHVHVHNLEGIRGRGDQVKNHQAV